MAIWQPVLSRVEKELKDKLERHYTKRDNRLYLIVRKEAIRNCAKLLSKSLDSRLSTISGVDVNHRFEIVYHFTFDEIGLIANVKCSIPKYDARIDSIADIILGANWAEREISDLFGVEFVGHPNLERLILPDEWPGDWSRGIYPLRRKR